MGSITIRRLLPEDAEQIVDCFRRAYGESYSNRSFYHAGRLSKLMKDDKLCSVGAMLRNGRLVGHMAMSRYRGATSAELGNTVVDPAARGEGVVWKVGVELASWTLELGYRGYLHYPTTAHHIMQRQSVESGFETGLMLGYIPSDTDARVSPKDNQLRGASTIVYQPLRDAEDARQFLPSYCSDLIRSWATSARIPRHWEGPEDSLDDVATEACSTHDDRRGLSRLTVDRVGFDVARSITEYEQAPADCRQIDFKMSDPGIERGVSAAREAGYWFCGWLPGFSTADVFRVQRVDRSRADMTPKVINPVAKSLLGLAAVPA